MREPEVGAPRAWQPAERAWAFAVLVALTVLLALWGAFLVPFRVGGTLVPVSWAVAVVGNLAVGWAGARLAGTVGALVPGGLWLLVVVVLSSQRSEGDLVVPGSLVGLVFLLAGALASAVAFAGAVLRPPAPGEGPGTWTARR